MLQESAMGLVLDLAPKPDAEQRAAGLRTAQEYYHRLGITACQDATVEPDYQETYERLARVRRADPARTRQPVLEPGPR